uniref:Copia protein n=1 Tax=Tanacetum cinerariifolium TaxID=118510 RepID=A0A6L2MNN7_TANCI|nr:copia protein [Tanacetum cinerariifolium]
MEAIRFTHTSEDEIENQVLEVIAPNEPDIPHTEDTEGPPDLINTEGTRKQNVQNDQMITQPTDVPLGNNTEVLGSISESLILDVTQSHISNQASTNIGSKWVFKNIKDEHGITTKNKARLVAQSYSQEKGIDYDETFVPVARMKAIRIFFAFATYMNFKVYQIDVKSTFLNGKLKEEVYVKQRLSFESSEFPNYVYKLDKALYGLKQAPKAWYETLSTFLIQNKFTIGRIDNTLSIYKSKVDVLLVQVYVDDIIFGSTSYKLCKQFEKLMTKKLEMGFDLKGYSDSDYASCNMDRKSTLAEIEYVVAAGGCPSIIWMKSQLNDYDIHYKMVPIFCDNTSAIAISSNPVLDGNYCSTEQVNSIHQLLAYCLTIRTEVDIGEIIYNDLGPEASGALSKKRQKPMSKKPPTETKVTPPKLTEGLTSTASDEGTTKTTPHLEGPLGDKDSGGNKPPANMEPINPSFVDPSGTRAKYQVDHTQSTRLRYQSLTENKCKLLYEGELDTQPLVLSTYADDRSFLLSDDEAQESEKDILEAGEEMNEDPQTASIAETHHQSPPPQADKPQSSYAPSIEASDTDSSCDEILKKYDNALPLTKRQLLGKSDGGSGELDGRGCESMYSIFGNGSSSGCHGGLWWLIEDEEDGEVNQHVEKLMNFFRSRKIGMIWNFSVLRVCKSTKISFVCEDGLAIEWNSENLTELLKRKSDEFVLNHEGDKNDARVILLKSDLTIKV